MALLDAEWLRDKKIVMLEPRRLAARAAARFMAHCLGEQVGETVGYRVRLDTRVGTSTRIEVVTEGVLTRLLQDDPALDAVGLVLFDEFHERSLQADLGLALCLDSQAALREDLRLVAMSATLDGAAVARLLGDAPILTSEGRSYPVDTRYRPTRTQFARQRRAFAEDVLRAVLTVLREEAGSVLVFLPGVGEIRQLEAALRSADPGDDVILAPLHGQLDALAQDTAIQPASGGKRKVVLATAIAETSLTIEGIRVVIDTGLMRLQRFGIHKRSGSTDSKASQGSSRLPDQSQHGGHDASRSSSHAYTEEAQGRASSRASSTFSLSSSGRGSMEDLHRGQGGSMEGSFSSYDSLRAPRQTSVPWMGSKATEEEVEGVEEEEEEEVREYEQMRRKEEEEKDRQEELMRIERRREEEEEQGKRRDEERMRREEIEKRQIEEQQQKNLRDEEDRIRMEMEEEERRRLQEDRIRMEEEERRRLQEDRIRMEREEEERRLQEDRIRMEREEEERRLQEDRIRMEREEEERSRLQEDRIRMEREEERRAGDCRRIELGWRGRKRREDCRRIELGWRGRKKKGVDCRRIELGWRRRKRREDCRRIELGWRGRKRRENCRRIELGWRGRKRRENCRRIELGWRGRKKKG